MQDDNDAMSGLVPDAYTQAVQGHQRQALLDALAGNGGAVSGFNPMSPEDSQEIALGDGAAPADALWNGGGAAMGKAMADSALTS